MPVAVKICGINDAPAMRAAIDNGVRFVGLVFFPPSPRAVTPQQAQPLAAFVPATTTKVGLFVDPTDDLLRDTLAQVPLDMIQLHGNETPERVNAVKRFTGLKVMKVISIAAAEDLKKIATYEPVADWLLLDAKAPKGSALPGGNAVAFDWNLLRDLKLTKPWMLAGGLNAANLAEAVHTTNAQAVDISSGVEDTAGHKNPDKIRQFLTLATAL